MPCAIPLRKAEQICAHAGFTLIELSVVVFLVALVMSVALPQLVPMIAFSELQGAARHMANYGRGAVAEATLLRETLMVRFDLDAQEYYTVRLVYPEAEEGEDYVDQWALMDQNKSFSSEDFRSSLGQRGGGGGLFGAPDGFDDTSANMQLLDQFDRFARRDLEMRARNVIQEEGILDEIGPLFEEDFSLDLDEPQEEELMDPVLERVRMPGTLRIESVTVDGVEQRSGVVEVELSALGLGGMLGAYLVNSDEEYYTVVWDPVTGQTRFLEGKQDFALETQ